ncbi:hypothetical protein HanHA89_Chr14g0562141 [Helianthus annuus]|nr:hypothetical protein HanHA89_Chr14g0562141 [Helianthus annuus]
MRVICSFTHKVQVLYAHQYKSLLSLSLNTTAQPPSPPLPHPPLPPPSHYRYLPNNYVHIFFFFFFERQIWITDGPLEYHRATRGTTRSYPSPLGIMPHQFRRKPNKHGKTPLVGIEPRTYWSQSLIPPPRCH